MHKRRMKRIATGALALAIALGSWPAGGTSRAMAAETSIPLNQDANLVGLWRLNEGAGDAIKDVTGLNAEALMGGADWQPGGGRHGDGAVAFDGTNKFYGGSAEGLNEAADTQRMTFAAAIKTSDVSGGKGLFARDNFRVSVNENNGIDGFVGGTYFSTPNQSIIPGQWHHIAVTYEQGTIRIFIDGAQQGSKTGAEALTAAGAYSVGANGWGSNYNGVIDDIRVFSRTLNEEEIAALAEDTTPPAAPANLTVKSAGETFISLSWEASYDYVGVAAYEVFVDGAATPVMTVTEPAAEIAGLTPGDHVFAIRAKDEAGNLSAASEPFTASTQKEDVLAPSAPERLTVAEVAERSVKLEWSAATDNKGVSRYLVFANDNETPAAVVPSLPGDSTVTAEVTGLSPNTAYSFTVAAEDASLNRSALSGAVEARTLEPLNDTSPLGINLSSVEDWQTQQPFKDLFKTAREWNNWNMAGLDLDENGWVKSLQPGQTAWTLLMTDTQGKYPAGDYVLLYDGEGELKVEFDAKANSHVKSENGLNNRMELTVTPQSGIKLTIESTNPSNYIRNIRVMEKKYESNYEAEPFNPSFLEDWSSFKVLRFMDFMRTNNSESANWEDRARKTYFTQSTGRGVAIEYMVELANELKADMWVNMPHLATDDYMRQFAAYVKANLNPESKIYIEWSNETWNSQFKQHQYAAAEGKKLGYTGSDMEIAFKYHGHRAGQMFTVWDDVFAEDKDRLFRVLGGFHHGGSWFTDMLVNQDDVYKKADAVAIAPYFGHSYGGEKAELVKSWTMDQVFADLTGELALSKQKSVEVIEAAAKKGLPVIAYEGGQHLSGIFYDGKAYWDDQALTDKLIAINRDPRMKDVYAQYLNDWKEIGGRLFMVFSSMGLPSKWGSWGVLEHPMQNRSDAPKYAAVTEFIAATPQWWDDSVRPEPELPPEVERLTAKNGLGYAAIDGELNESMWISEDAAVAKPVNGTPNNTASFRAFWDATNLYVGIQVEDADLRNDSSETHNDDSVEIYIDSDHNKGAAYDANDRQFVLGYGDSELFEKTGQTAGVQYAMKPTSNGYTAEFAIPWSSLGAEAEAGRVIGLDIGVNDDDEGGERESQLMWSGTNENWRTTERFGDLTLSAETVGKAEQPVAVQSVAFQDLNGAELTSLKGESFFSAVVKLKNRASTPQQAAVVMTLRDEKGKTHNIAVVENSIGANSEETYIAGFQLPKQTKGLYVEVLVLDSLTSRQPLSDRIVFPSTGGKK